MRSEAEEEKSEEGERGDPLGEEARASRSGGCPSRPRPHATGVGLWRRRGLRRRDREVRVASNRRSVRRTRSQSAHRCKRGKRTNDARTLQSSGMADPDKRAGTKGGKENERVVSRGRERRGERNGAGMRESGEEGAEGGTSLRGRANNDDGADEELGEGERVGMLQSEKREGGRQAGRAGGRAKRLRRSGRGLRRSLADGEASDGDPDLVGPRARFCRRAHKCQRCPVPCMQSAVLPFDIEQDHSSERRLPATHHCACAHAHAH